MVKEIILKEASLKPEEYYPVDFLKSKGYLRKKCKKCGKYFWTLDEEREVCGEPECIGGYKFIGKEDNAKNKLDYIASWKVFSKMFKKRGYDVVNRYPVVARWRDDLDFVIASIAPFQPYVVKGEVEPPSKHIIIPQFSLRFNDIDNVGYSGRHYTGFVMIGQHAFVPPKEYDKNKYLEDIHIWLVEGIGIKEEEIVYHEDAWEGGGNAGPSMEFFARGLEIGNQVYMQYEVKDNDIKPLELAVLDMGMGQERVAWYTHGYETSYETTFPSVMSYLYRSTGLKYNKDLWLTFLPYSSLLNFDEIDATKAWKLVSEKTGIDVSLLKQEIEPISELFAIAEHTRTLLFAIADGALPSNVGGGYNLRIIARRVFEIIERRRYGIDMYKILEKHASYLKPQYPELEDHIADAVQILSIEEKKYKATKEKAKKIIKGLKGKEVSLEKIIELYESRGILPEWLVKAGIIKEVPSNFYASLSKRYEKKRKEEYQETPRLNVSSLPSTIPLYWGDWKPKGFEAKIIKILHNKYIVLDKTEFYPTSGGQSHDIGKILANNKEYYVKKVFKVDNVIIHEVENTKGLQEGNKIKGIVDFERRAQLAKHHTAAHILNYAAREVLGNWVWQAGAEKTIEKGRLDITHYELPSHKQIKEIENIANEIVEKEINIEKVIMPRNIAEKKYGFRIYQGGAVPGKELRIVKIADYDIEACGGTHLNNTIEAGLIKIIDVKKIQDGVIRLEYVAGKASLKYVQQLEEELDKAANTLRVSRHQVAKTAEKFFEIAKEKEKEAESLKAILIKYALENAKVTDNIGEINLSFEKNVKEGIKTAKIFLAKKRANTVIVKLKNNYIIVGKKANEIVKERFKGKDIKGKGDLFIIT